MTYDAFQEAMSANRAEGLLEKTQRRGNAGLSHRIVRHLSYLHLRALQNIDAPGAVECADFCDRVMKGVTL